MIRYINKEKFDIPNSFEEKARTFAHNFNKNSNKLTIPSNSEVRIGLFVGDKVKCKQEVQKFNGLECNSTSNPNYSVFFAPCYTTPSGVQIDILLEGALADDNIFNKRNNLIEVINTGPDLENFDMPKGILRSPRNRFSSISSNNSKKASIKKESISRSMYDRMSEDLVKGDPEGLALVFSTKIRELPAKVVDPILDRFNQKLVEAGVDPAQAIDLPLIAFLGKNDIININGKAVIPIEITKTSKPKKPQVIEIEYLDLTDMQIKDQPIEALKDRIEKIIIDKQKIKQLSINSFVDDRNKFIDKLKSSKNPSQGGMPAIFFMLNKLDSELNSRISSLKLQISYLKKKAKDYKSNPLLINIEIASDEEMSKPFGSSKDYSHPIDYLKSILREMHYKGKLKKIVEELHRGSLQKKYNPTNDPRLTPVFEALIEFGEELLKRQSEKNTKENEKDEEREENFSTGVSELPVLNEIEKLRKFEIDELPIETKKLSPNLYKSDYSRKAMPSESIKNILKNLKEAEETKERLSNIRYLLLKLNNQGSLKKEYLSSPYMRKDINQIESLFKQLSGFVTKYRRPIFKSDGTVDKTKIGSTADPIANLNICDYIILLNTKVKLILDDYLSKKATYIYSKKLAQSAPPAPPAPPALPGMPGAPAEKPFGELKSPDMDDEGEELRRLQEEFDKIIGKKRKNNSHHSRHYIELLEDEEDDNKGALTGWIADAVWDAIRRTGSRRGLHQIDVAVSPDPDYPDKIPPFIRGVSGPDLGVAPTNEGNK